MSLPPGCINACAFWEPEFVQRSAWMEHAPFAFWLVSVLRPNTFVELGTHNGYSYFSFCQAVAKLGLNSRCYAVDTWRGDEHAGFYGEDVFDGVTEYNTAKYLSISTLIRSTFEEALSLFSDNSVDLLHIDGRHFYDDVKQDFESWEPKLSTRSVVVFHDTNVRNRDFGVYRLWEEWADKRPSFEFLHANGLGILGYGGALPTAVRDFFELARQQETASNIRTMYSRLGSTISAAYYSQLKLKQLDPALKRQEAEPGQLLLAEPEVILSGVAAHMPEPERENSRLIARYQTDMSRVAAELAHQEMEGARLVAEVSRLSGRVAQRDKEVAQLTAKLEHGASETPRSASELRQRDREVVRLGTELSLREAKIARLTAEIALRETKISRLSARLEQYEKDAARLETQAKASEMKSPDSATEARRLGTADEGARPSTSFPVQPVQPQPSGSTPKGPNILAAVWSTLTLRRRRSRRSGPQTGSQRRHGTRAGRIAQSMLQSGLFDADWYLARNPDVTAAGVDPLTHYVDFGASEGRDPNAFFDSDWYLAKYGDVAKSGMNPLDHYIRFGAAEGRDPSPLFDTGWYVQNNPDVARSGLNPLAHYLRFGTAEGRPAKKPKRAAAGSA